MKKTQSLSSFLGLTQDDLSLLLNLNRSLYAKYEQGSRNIPLASKALLSEIMAYVNAPEASFTSSAVAGQYAKKQVKVLAMLKENEYQQELTARKITRVETKCGARLRALQVVEFLSNREDTQDETSRAILRSIGRKTAKSLKSEGLGLLFSLKLRLYMLQLEKLLLQSEVRKGERSAENTGSKERFTNENTATIMLNI